MWQMFAVGEIKFARPPRVFSHKRRRWIHRHWVTVWPRNEKCRNLQSCAGRPFRYLLKDGNRRCWLLPKKEEQMPAFILLTDLSMAAGVKSAPTCVGWLAGWLADRQELDSRTMSTWRKIVDLIPWLVPGNRLPPTLRSPEMPVNLITALNI